MGTSYLVVRDRLESIYDMDLLVLVHLLLRHAEASGNEHPELIESLRETLKTQGPGVVDLKLEWIVADPSRKSHFLGLLDAVDTEVDGLGGADPLCGFDRARFAQMKLSEVVASLSKFDSEDTIYAIEPWNADSEVMVMREPGAGGVPRAAAEKGDRKSVV